MKNRPFALLVILTSLLTAFTLGFLTGKTQNHEQVFLSSIPTDSRHAGLPEPTASPDATVPGISFPIDLNTAGLRELTALPGIGEGIARRILDYREHYGPFSRPEELLNVNGIGEKKLEDILDFIATGG